MHGDLPAVKTVLQRRAKHRFVDSVFVHKIIRESSKLSARSPMIEERYNIAEVEDQGLHRGVCFLMAPNAFQDHRQERASVYVRCIAGLCGISATPLLRLVSENPDRIPLPERLWLIGSQKSHASRSLDLPPCSRPRWSHLQGIGVQGLNV